MMAARTRNMEQTLTYWGPGANDGFGNVAYSSPITLQGRFQKKNDLFRDASAREVVSEAIAYTDQAVSLKGYLAVGDQTGTATPIGLSGAYEIRAIGESPDLRNSEVLYKAWL